LQLSGQVEHRVNGSALGLRVNDAQLKVAALFECRLPSPDVAPHPSDGQDDSGDRDMRTELQGCLLQDFFKNRQLELRGRCLARYRHYLADSYRRGRAVRDEFTDG
jgi:hypothetical protein